MFSYLMLILNNEYPQIIVSQKSTLDKNNLNVEPWKQIFLLSEQFTKPYFYYVN